MKFRAFFIPTGAAIFAIAFSGVAQATDCPAFPQVSLWGKMSHQKTISYVNNSHDGDWASYAQKWGNQLTNLEQIYLHGSAATFSKKKGISLSGEELSDYIENLRKRIEVIGCLAKTQEAMSLDALNNFSTAAGPVVEDKPEIKSYGQTTINLSGGVEVQVNTSCQGNMAIFQLVNMGSRWPKRGDLSVFQIDGKARLSKRKMRLANGQKASFKVKGQGTLGLWVDAPWQPRTFDYDVKVTCG